MPVIPFPNPTEPTTTSKVPPRLWPTARSLKPNAWLTHACAAGDEEAQAIAEAYRFQFPVTRMSPEAFAKFIKRGTFAGHETNAAGYIADVIGKVSSLEFEDDSSPIPGYEPEDRPVDYALTNTEGTHEDVGDEDIDAPTAPLTVKWNTVAACHRAVNYAAASFVCSAIDKESFAGTLFDFAVWKGQTSHKHNMQRDLGLVEDFANSFAGHVLTKFNQWKREKPFTHFLERSYSNWTKNKYKTLNRDAAVTDRAPLGYHDKDGVWHEYAFALNKRERELNGVLSGVISSADQRESKMIEQMADLLNEMDPETRMIAQLHMMDETDKEICEVADVSRPTLHKREASLKNPLERFLPPTSRMAS